MMQKPAHARVQGRKAEPGLLLRRCEFDLVEQGRPGRQHQTKAQERELVGRDAIGYELCTSRPCVVHYPIEETQLASSVLVGCESLDNVHIVDEGDTRAHARK